MFQFADTTARTLAAATVLSVLVVASPSWAATTGQPQPAAPAALLAQANPTPATPAPAAAPKRSAADRVETRIKSLHEQLKITSAQGQPWSAVAQAMRDNAQAMQGAIQQRREAKSLSAVDDLKAYEAITQVHLQGLQQLIPPFQTLYDAMSVDQKKTADALFSQTRHGHHGSMKKSSGAK